MLFVLEWVQLYLSNTLYIKTIKILNENNFEFQIITLICVTHKKSNVKIYKI